MFKAIMVSKSPPQSSTTSPIPLHEDPLWGKPVANNTIPTDAVHGMQGIQLFPSDNPGNTALAILGTPKKANPLKRRAASTPTKSPPNMDSSGGEPC